MLPFFGRSRAQPAVSSQMAKSHKLCYTKSYMAVDTKQPSKTENIYRTKPVTAIVPAYNEGERIGPVLEVLTSYLGFREVIVVDDGSKDNTEEVARQFPVRFEKNPKNMGKAHSMDRGVAMAETDVIFFCDADIHGLTHAIIDEVVVPVVEDETEMFIAMRNRTMYGFRYSLLITPLFGGERALTKHLWEILPSYYKYRFRIEAGLNFYAKYYAKGFRYKVYKGLSQTLKETKYGFFDGTRQRIGMFWDIFRAELRLNFVDVPKNEQSRRITFATVLEGVVGLIIGFGILTAGLIGPVEFMRQVFGEAVLAGDGVFGLAVYYLTLFSLRALIGIGILLLAFHIFVLLMSVYRFIKLSKMLPPFFRRLPPDM